MQPSWKECALLKHKKEHTGMYKIIVNLLSNQLSSSEKLVINVAGKIKSWNTGWILKYLWNIMQIKNYLTVTHILLNECFNSNKGGWIHILLSKLNSTQLKLVWPHYGYSNPPTTAKLLDHFQTTQEADFRHATLF